MFIPVFNVDGLNLIERNWIQNKTILMKRKNMDQKYCQKGFVDAGVDLNRNFGVDFG